MKTVTSHDTRNALDALLAGKPVPVEKTRVFGCSTKWSDKREDARKSLEKWDQEPVKLDPLDEAGIAKLVKNDTDKLLVINVWATWCGPCVAELPELVDDEPHVPQAELPAGHDQHGRARPEATPP